MKYLDDRPVFPDERRIAEAWSNGGREAENEMRKFLQEEKANNQKKVAEEFRKKSEETKQKRLFLYEKTIKEYEIELENLKEAKQTAIMQQKSEHYLAMFQEDIEIQEKKIKDLKESIDNLSLFKPNPYQSFSATRNENGDITVWNKSRQEANFIKEHLIVGEDPKPNILEEEEKKENNEEIIESNQNNKEIAENETKSMNLSLVENDKHVNAWTVLNEGNEEISKEKIEQKEWDNENYALLEALLEKYQFDFTKVCEEFNRVLKEIHKKMGKENAKVFQEKDLRLRWTEKEKNLRGLRQKNEGVDLDDLD